MFRTRTFIRFVNRQQSTVNRQQLKAIPNVSSLLLFQTEFVTLQPIS
ncbi:hypothetical protein H6G33_32750 [Calothrix sp. FACHB-1219]|nr:MULTISPECIES: hypothetical protein [unclassified Calothrix]MBD2202642.1 hypothetical protein [Calothrix sp. FACHB-168]MBD2221728.1 hypothetical protein [Calothrix sp. FACHB-1219]